MIIIMIVIKLSLKLLGDVRERTAIGIREFRLLFLSYRFFFIRFAGPTRVTENAVYPPHRPDYKIDEKKTLTIGGGEGV